MVGHVLGMQGAEHEVRMSEVVHAVTRRRLPNHAGFSGRSPPLRWASRGRAVAPQELQRPPPTRVVPSTSHSCSSEAQTPRCVCRQAVDDARIKEEQLVDVRGVLRSRRSTFGYHMPPNTPHTQSVTKLPVARNISGEAAPGTARPLNLSQSRSTSTNGSRARTQVQLAAQAITLTGVSRCRGRLLCCSLPQS
jgi:hypothetical protein